MDKKKNSTNNEIPLETYTVYKQSGAEPPREENRNAKELTMDEYYGFLEDDRIIPEKK